MNGYKYYHATIKYVTTESTPTGKQKLNYKKTEYLVNSVSISSAEKTLQSLLASVYDSFTIISIKESAIQGVMTEVVDVLGM